VLAPWASVVVGVICGVLVMLGVELLERLKIDDAVGAFPVHGMGGAMGTLLIGLFAQPELTGGAGGLLLGGGLGVLATQVTGVVAAIVWTGVTAGVMFAVLKGLGLLRVHEKADKLGGIDVYEHGTTVWPDVLPVPDAVSSAAVGD
jgi:Amt family ammonium transporter